MLLSKGNNQYIIVQTRCAMLLSKGNNQYIIVQTRCAMLLSMGNNQYIIVQTQCAMLLSMGNNQYIIVQTRCAMLLLKRGADKMKLNFSNQSPSQVRTSISQGGGSEGGGENYIVLMPSHLCIYVVVTGRNRSLFHCVFQSH